MNRLTKEIERLENMKEMKIFSGKKAALNSLPSGSYKSGKYCNHKYKTTIKTMKPISDDIKALYKVYGKDKHGSYVTINYIEGGAWYDW